MPTTEHHETPPAVRARAVNGGVCDMAAYRRRRREASRCEPLASGRRDPHRGPDRWTAPQVSAADLDVLRTVWTRTEDEAERVALERIARAVADLAGAAA